MENNFVLGYKFISNSKFVQWINFNLMDRIVLGEGDCREISEVNNIALTFVEFNRICEASERKAEAFFSINNRHISFKRDENISVYTLELFYRKDRVQPTRRIILTFEEIQKLLDLEISTEYFKNLNILNMLQFKEYFEKKRNFLLDSLPLSDYYKIDLNELHLNFLKKYPKLL